MRYDTNLARVTQAVADLTVQHFPAGVVGVDALPLHPSTTYAGGAVEAASIVHGQYTGLRTGAGTTLRDGAQTIALDFDGPALPGLHQDGNVVPSLYEGGGEVGSYTRYDGIGLGYVGNGLTYRNVTRSDGGGGHTEPEVLQEVAARSFQTGVLGLLLSDLHVGRGAVLRAVFELIGTDPVIFLLLHTKVGDWGSPQMG